MNYNNRENVTWTIKADTGKCVKLEFVTFELEKYNCYYDYLTVTDKDNNNSVEKYCGCTPGATQSYYNSYSGSTHYFSCSGTIEEYANYPPNTKKSTGSNGFELFFKTDSIITLQGFHIRFNATGKLN